MSLVSIAYVLTILEKQKRKVGDEINLNNNFTFTCIEISRTQATPFQILLFRHRRGVDCIPLLSILNDHLLTS